MLTNLTNPSRAQKRTPGRWAKRVRIAADFDAALPDGTLRGFEADNG